MEDQIRSQLTGIIKGGLAFDTFEEVIAEFKPDEIGVIPKGAQRSAWQIVEHMRLSLRDIIEYSQNEDGTYEEKEWPEGYWPKTSGPSSSSGWKESVDAFLRDREELIHLVRTNDLLRPFSWAPEHNLLRQVLVAAQHISYHCGQLVLVSELVSAS